MVRVLAAFGLLFLLLVVVVLVYIRASQQLADTWSQCVTDSDIAAHLADTKSGADISLFFADTVNCVDQRKGFLAGLLFDREDAFRKIEQQFRDLAAVQAKQEKEFQAMEEEARARQSDWEAEQNLQEFRQGVYQANPGR